MNVRDYIESGILEEYCLGMLNEDEQAVVQQICVLFPEVKKELETIERTMENIAADQSVMPGAGMRQKILSSLGFAEPVNKFSINELPVTDAYSNHHTWLNTLQHLISGEPTEDFACHILRQDDQFAQMLVITKTDVPEETHENVMESFFILKGECRCVVGNKIFRLGPGDFLKVPLYQPHDVKILSPYVVAVLQHYYL